MKPDGGPRPLAHARPVYLDPRPARAGMRNAMQAAALLLWAGATANAYALGTATPTDIPGLIVLDADVPADYVNAITAGSAGNPPFTPGTSVYRVRTTQAFVAIRSYCSPADPGKAGQAGGWIAPIAETRGLSRAQLMDRLALPVNADGTRNNTFALVLVPAGTTFWSGPAGPITDSKVPPVGAYWGAGGGIQYYVGRNAGDVSGFQVPLKNYVLAAPMGELNLLAYSPRLTGNALAVGSYMDKLGVQAYGDLDKVLTSLDMINLSTPSGDQKLQQTIALLGAERHGALGLAGLHQSRLFMDQLTAASGAEEQGKRAWIYAQGERAKQSSDADRTGFTQHTSMLLAGFEMRYRDNWTLGAAAAYLSSDIDWADSAPGQGTLKSGYVGAYGSFRKRAWMATGQLFVGYGSIATRRSIDIPDAGLWPGYSFALNRSAAGSTNAVAGGARLDVARVVPLGKASLVPFLGLEYQRFARRNFTESGADSVDLAVQSKTLDDLRFRLGTALELALGRAASLGWSLTGRLLISPRLAGDDGALTAAFAGQSATFSSSAWRSPAELAQAGIGLSGRSANAAVALTYNCERGSGFEAKALMANAAWRF